jgi:N-acetylglucosaminyldiphosphoundecaprenol N-acetyl-beta-D-mannosaminyltransferase
MLKSLSRRRSEVFGGRMPTSPRHDVAHVPDLGSIEPVDTVLVGGFDTAVVTNEQLASIMLADCLARREFAQNRPKLVFSSNGQGLSLAANDKGFRDVMRSADVIHADGQSVVIGSRLFAARQLPERVATTDFFHYAARTAQEFGLSFFLLGSSESENEKAARNVANLYPQLSVVGRHHGYFSKQDEIRVVDAINAARPDVLWVGLGKPRQEFWCAKMRNNLDVGWIKTCGGLFGFLSGHSKRAPYLMQRLGLEWLHRASQDPKRLAKRYLRTNPHAIYLLATKSRARSTT